MEDGVPREIVSFARVNLPVLPPHPPAAFDVATNAQAGDGRVTIEATVTYRPSDVLGFWVPWEMRETYTTAGERVLGKARYDNFRRFQVSTSVEVK